MICLTVVFLFKEGPQLVGSLLGRVLIFWELALLLLRDQLKYGLGREQHTNKCLQVSIAKFLLCGFGLFFNNNGFILKNRWVCMFAAVQLDMKVFD